MSEETKKMPTQQPVGSSGLYPKNETHWTVSNSEIHVQLVVDGSTGTKSKFVAKGVRYQPTPINMDNGAAGSPMGDLFYIGSSGDETMMFYEPIWKRDVGPAGLMRTAGINSLAVYNTFNVPSFTMQNADGSVNVESSASTAEAALIDWTPLGPIRYVEVDGNYYPTYMPEGASSKAPPPYWYHFNHDRFLDLCWNDGDPIYVWLAVGVSLDSFFSSNPAGADGYKYTQIQKFYKKTAEWLAKSYCNHPALAGFVITNETNTSDTNDQKEYWDFINEINTILKTNAPHKLTMVGFQDNPNTLSDQLVQYVSTPTPGDSAPATESLYVQSDGSIGTTKTSTPATAKDIYEVDVWGWNLYGEASDQTDIIQFATSISGTSHEKPVIISEMGIPASMRYDSVAGISDGTLGGNDPYYLDPNGYQAIWSATTQTTTVERYDSSKPALGIEGPAIQSTTSAKRTGKDYLKDHSQYDAGGLIAYETDTSDYYLLVGQPGQSGVWTKLDTTKYGTLLDYLRTNNVPGAAAGVALYGYLLAAGAYQPGGSASSLLSGVMVFEWNDEWFKWQDPNQTAANNLISAGVHDFRDSAIQPWGPADAQFYTVWDEEWFGICSVLPTGRSSTDRAISTDGWLNGGADTLTERAGFYATKLFYTGSL